MEHPITKKLSVIVPMFNVEDYVERAISSALRQDLPTYEYEIIIVDDMSTDRSREIAERMAGENPNIRLVTNPSKGLSNARNYGLELAQGRYILYLDSDDYFNENVFGSIVSKMEEDSLDMLIFSYSMVAEDGIVYKTPNILRVERNSSDILSGHEFLIKGLCRAIVWTFCYDTLFLRRSGVYMLNIPHEDENFVPRIISRASRITFKHLDVYNYFVRPNSIMNNYKPSNLLGLLEGISHMRDDITTAYPQEEELCKAINSRCSRLTVYAIKKAVREGYGNERELIDFARKSRLLPVLNRTNFKKFLLNHYPGMYIRYYSIKGKKRTRVK